MENLIIKMNVILEEHIKEVEEEGYGFDQDEILDVTSAVTDCEGCNPNSAWGFIRGYEQAIRDIEHITKQEKGE